MWPSAVQCGRLEWMPRHESRQKTEDKRTNTHVERDSIKEQRAELGGGRYRQLGSAVGSTKLKRWIRVSMTRLISSQAKNGRQIQGASFVTALPSSMYRRYLVKYMHWEKSQFPTICCRHLTAPRPAAETSHGILGVASLVHAMVSFIAHAAVITHLHSLSRTLMSTPQTACPFFFWADLSLLKASSSTSLTYMYIHTGLPLHSPLPPPPRQGVACPTASIGPQQRRREWYVCILGIGSQPFCMASNDVSNGKAKAPTPAVFAYIELSRS